MISIVLAAAITQVSLAEAAQAQAQWVACAREVAAQQLAQGIPASWPVVASLPDDAATATEELGTMPEQPAYDPVRQVLRGYPVRNVFYIERSGGIGDFHRFYGPIPLAGRCAPVPARAP